MLSIFVGLLFKDFYEAFRPLRRPSERRFERRLWFEVWWLFLTSQISSRPFGYGA